MMAATLAFAALLAAGAAESVRDQQAAARTTPIDLGLQLSITPPDPVLGVNQEVSVTVTSSIGPLPPSAWASLRMLTSAGEVQDLTPSGPAAWSGRLVLPTRRAPQGLIVAAQMRSADIDVAGALFVPLPAVASPAFQTDPRAEVTLTVAGRVFGPKRASATGDVRVPVVVPPGVSMAVARTTNAVGKMAEEILDLGVPPFSRLLVLAPETATHGRPTEVLVFGMDAHANPAPQTAFALQANGRRAHPLHGGPGWTRFLATAPLLSAHPRMQLRAYETAPGAAPSEPSPATTDVSAHAEVALLAGPAARLMMIPNRVALAVGSTQRLALVVRAEDMWGEATSTANTRLYINGAPVANATRSEGRLRVTVPAPKQALADAKLVVEAIDGNAYARHEVSLEVTARQAPALPVPPSPEYSWAALGRVGPLFGADTGWGLGITAEAQAQLGRWIRWPQGLFLQSSLGYVTHQRNIDSNTGLSRLRAHAMPLLLGAAWRVRPLRSVSVFLGIQAGPARLWVQNSTLGAQVNGAAWTGALRLSVDVVFGTGQTQLAVGASFSDIPGGKLGSGDVVRGNLGGAAATLGVRQRW